MCLHAPPGPKKRSLTRWFDDGLITTMAEAHFRPATAADTDRLLEMMRLLWNYDAVDFNEAQSRRGLDVLFRADGGRQGGRIWMIEWEGADVGYLVLTFAFSLEFGGWHAFVDELYVRDGFRSRGWGSQALDLAAATCRELGMSALLLEADLRNHRATELYKRRGFREHHRRLMRLDLLG
jgi:ribosomal protein S18 acetylase RimI-like enzyme